MAEPALDEYSNVLKHADEVFPEGARLLFLVLRVLLDLCRGLLLNLFSWLLLDLCLFHFFLLLMIHLNLQQGSLLLLRFDRVSRNLPVRINVDVLERLDDSMRLLRSGILEDCGLLLSHNCRLVDGWLWFLGGVRFDEFLALCRSRNDRHTGIVVLGQRLVRYRSRFGWRFDSHSGQVRILGLIHVLLRQGLVYGGSGGVLRKLHTGSRILDYGSLLDLRYSGRGITLLLHRCHRRTCAVLGSK